MGRSLKERGAVLLLSCYELGHQPMGLAWTIAFLQRAGFHPEAIDTSVEPLSEEQIRRARFIGISVPMHTALRLGFQKALRVREINSGVTICFFGLYAFLNSEFLMHHGADYVIGGECEEPLTRLVCALEAGDSEGAAEIGSTNSAGPYLHRLDFPLPSRRDLPPLERYARLEHHGTMELVGYVETTRGCKYHCLHCPIPPVYDGKFFAVPREVVLEDIRRQVAVGARHITFGDPDFLNGPTHSLKIVRELAKEFHGVTFDFTTKVEHLVRYGALLREFADCGCVFVVSAVESLSERVLANLEKGHTRADVYRALRNVRDASIVLRPSLVAFTPWTTLQDYLELLGFVRDEALIGCVEPIQYALRLLIPPRSLLLTRPEIRPYLKRLVPEKFTYEWTHPDPRMDALHTDVAELVRTSVAENTPVEVTFARVSALAGAAHDGQPPRDIAPTYVVRPEWRLTEPWFC